MPTPPKIYYLVYFGFEQTVIESQVLTPIRELRDEGINISLIFMESISTYIKIKLGFSQVSQYKKLHPLRYRILPRIPKNFFHLNTFLLFFHLFGDLIRRCPILIHARGFQGAAVALTVARRFKKIRVLCDVRGLESAEYDYATRRRKKGNISLYNRFWKRKLEKYEEVAIYQSHFHSFVSKSLRAYFKVKWEGGEYVPMVLCPLCGSVLQIRFIMDPTRGVSHQIGF